MTQDLGDYISIKQLGQGSLGAVWLAQHRFLKRPFVLKVIPSEVASEEGFIERFRKEVSGLSSLDHPHIAKIHNVSESKGTYFLVTDCIVDDKGESLHFGQYLHEKGGRLPEEEAVRIAYQIAGALDYAHEKGFAHRCLKPSNIVVAKKKEGVHVYLTDLGLIKVANLSQMMARTFRHIAESAGQEAVGLSKLHLSFLHHYLFLAPELKLSAGPVNEAKADIYAFGVLMYLSLTGRFPEGVFELPSQIAPQYKLNWDRLIKSCLQSDPLKRPGLLKDALDNLLPETPSGETSFLEPTASLKPILQPGEIQRPEFEADPGAVFQTETIVARYQPKAPEVKAVSPMHTEMSVIRGGSFFRGSDSGGRDEMPRHEVLLDSFAMDTHPVTNEQFVLFLEAMGGEKDHNNNDIIRLRESRIKRSSGKLSIESGYARHPVVGVTWYGAVAYAKWVGKRLPTEAEWEVAASAASDECMYPTGKNIERTQANFFSSDTTPVMSYPPNGLGLYDMAGNVYEWCQDWYDFHYYDASVQEPNNPKGPLQGVYRVLRGGCWKSLKEDLRCSHRHRNNPGTMNGTYGFRCAADVVDESK